MLGRNWNLVLNPWKLAFYLIFLANIVFHSSPSFLLLFILLGIFGYGYLFLSEVFAHYTSTYRQDVVDVLEDRFLIVEKEMEHFQNLLRTLSETPSLFFSLIKVWGGGLLVYKCDSFPLNRNFFFTILERTFAEECSVLREGIYYLDYNSPAAKSSFLEHVVD